jgi:hypothetical protein
MEEYDLSLEQDSVRRISPEDSVRRISPEDSVRRISPEDSVRRISPEDSPIIEIDDIWIWDIKEDTLDHVIERMNPLDLILFSGTNLFSKTIKIVEKRKYGIGNISHIGMVINQKLIPDVKQMDPCKYYIWESTSSKINWSGTKKLQDIFGKNKFGVQIRDLKTVIQVYLDAGGRVFWGKLINNPYKPYKDETASEYHLRFKALQVMMTHVYNTYGQASYNYNIIDLLSSVYSIFRPLRKLKKWFTKKKNRKHPLFCSEFIAIIYLAIGVINRVDPRNIVPVDFLGITEKGIPLILKKIVEISKQL